MSGWARLCGKFELPGEGNAREFSAGGRAICVAMIKGKPLAVDNECPHHGAQLSMGMIDGDRVVCPWHGWEFNMKTGEAEHNHSVVVQTYPLKIEDKDVLIEI